MFSQGDTRRVRQRPDKGQGKGNPGQGNPGKGKPDSGKGGAIQNGWSNARDGDS